MDKKQIKKLEANKKFFGNWASTYDFSLFQWWMRGFQREVKKSFILSKETKILDISCGTGELLKELQGKAQLTGVDFSEEMLEKARGKLAKDVELKQADVHELPFKENTFDIVISTEAFHHYYDQEKAVKEMMRVTKKGIQSACMGIASFIEVPTCVGVRLEKDDSLTICAPYGLEDLFTFHVRPISQRAEVLVHYKERMKTKQWKKLWPRLRIDP